MKNSELLLLSSVPGMIESTIPNSRHLPSEICRCCCLPVQDLPPPHPAIQLLLLLYPAPILYWQQHHEVVLLQLLVLVLMLLVLLSWLLLLLLMVVPSMGTKVLLPWVLADRFLTTSSLPLP